jgi:hypothetical protein
MPSEVSCHEQAECRFRATPQLHWGEVGIGRLKRVFSPKNAQHRHYPAQHRSNTFADVFADSLWVCLTEL